MQDSDKSNKVASAATQQAEPKTESDLLAVLEAMRADLRQACCRLDRSSFLGDQKWAENKREKWGL